VNVGLVVALVTLIGLAIRRHYASTPPADPRISRSAKVVIEGVDFSKSSSTLLLAVGKGCHYCSNSARFYRRLVQGLSDVAGARMVVVSSDAPSDTKYYLKSLGIEVNEIRQVQLHSIGIRIVPTVALLDQNGVVKNVWIGQLPPKTESELMTAAGFKDTRPAQDWILGRDDLQRRRSAGEKVTLVDLRDRSSYAHEHLPNSTNIPSDELGVRAQNELSKDSTIVLYSDDGAVADLSYLVLFRQDFRQIFILDETNRQVSPATTP